MEAPVKYPTEPESHSAVSESNPTVAHEDTDADAHSITVFGIALAFTIVLVHLLLWGMFALFSGREAKLSPHVPAIIKTQAATEPPEPRLQGNPQLDLKKMLEDEDAALNHYGWVDPEHGIVRIPIQRALEIAAEKGLPQFKGIGASAADSIPRAPDPGENPAGKAFGAKPRTSK